MTDLFKEVVTHTGPHNPRNFFDMAFPVVVQLIYHSLVATVFVAQIFQMKCAVVFTISIAVHRK
jgi:hypothetical protein